MIRTDRHHLMLHGPDDVEVVDLATGSVRRLNGSIDNVLPWTAFCDDVLDLAAAGKRPAVNMADMADVMRLIQDSYRLAGPLPTASSPSLSTAG
jgi:hypothetical protein